MIIRDHSPNSLWKILCSLRYGATQRHTHIHIHTSDERFTHTCHTCHTHTFECLWIYVTHTHRTTWIPLNQKETCVVVILTRSLHFFFRKKNLAFLLEFYHGTKMGKSLRYIYRYTFTQHTHMVQKNLGGCIFITQFLVFHLHNDCLFTCHLFFFYTLEWSVT